MDDRRRVSGFHGAYRCACGSQVLARWRLGAVAPSADFGERHACGE